MSAEVWRCDVLATPTAHTKTSWHRTQGAAELAERSALKAGAHRAVSWRYK